MGEDPGLADRELTVPAGRDALPHIRGVHALLPSAPGVLGRSDAENESVWLKHPHHVSVLTGTSPGGLYHSFQWAITMYFHASYCGKRHRKE